MEDSNSIESIQKECLELTDVMDHLEKKTL